MVTVAYLCIPLFFSFDSSIIDNTLSIIGSLRDRVMLLLSYLVKIYSISNSVSGASGDRAAFCIREQFKTIDEDEYFIAYSYMHKNRMILHWACNW